jgi:quinol monooxygenase YgiN
MNNKPYTVLALFEAKPGKEQALKEALTTLIKPTRAEEGCINYDLHQDRDNPAKFMFHENWVNKEAHAKHGTTPHIQAWRAKRDELIIPGTGSTAWEMIDG